MSGGTVSHNTEKMREWASKLDDNNNLYNDMVESLFSKVNYLVGSSFSGDLAENFRESVVNKRPDFDNYSSTFEETVAFIRERASAIDDDTSRLKTKMNNETMF